MIATCRDPVAQEVADILTRLGVSKDLWAGGDLVAVSPIDGNEIGRIHASKPSDADSLVRKAHRAHLAWRCVPAPRRGEFVRLLGQELRSAKTDLGRLVTLESGKILSEGLGEVQEMIDICDYAVGLSRQLSGLTLTTERKDHRMMETWHPIGVVGVISAFNFPVAVWSWNAALALVCGDSVVWKPSEKTLLCALAVHAIVERVAQRFGSEAPEGLCVVLPGGRDIGELLVDHKLVPLVSATGSTGMGRQVGARLAARFARAILELGGNNAAIVTPSADQDLALRAIAFSAMGTAGQRCTTLRRLFVHETIYADFVCRLKKIFRSARIGDPREPGVLIGPLIDEAAGEAMRQSLADALQDGAIIHGGERVDAGGGCYVRPAVVEMAEQTGVVMRETFAPILYVMKYRDIAEAIAAQNAAPQGLSSSIFTLSMREAELFVSDLGSDCGIANINLGPSGAEIGGAFGGEKETGGGREAGSDSWKAYMRRATNTINYGVDLPLAQGVTFDV